MADAVVRHLSPALLTQTAAVGAVQTVLGGRDDLASARRVHRYAGNFSFAHAKPTRQRG
jgi:hypothetical protein